MKKILQEVLIIIISAILVLVLAFSVWSFYHGTLPITSNDLSINNDFAYIYWGNQKPDDAIFKSTSFTQSVLPVIGVAVVAFLIFSTEQMLSRNLFKMQAFRHEMDIPGNKKECRVKTTDHNVQEYKIRQVFQRFHINVSHSELLVLNIMRFGMAILPFSAMRLVFNFPITVSMAGGFMGILIANSLLDNVWMKLRNTIDQEIPIFLSGITSAVRANQNVLQAVEEVASGLKENSPLKTWLLERFVQISQEQGESSIDEMVEEAFRITNYLGVLIFLIGRLWRIGGMNWRQSFAQAASNLKGLLETKEHGFAAIASAKNAMKVIIFVTMLIVMVMARNPVFSSAMESPLVQAVYALATIMMIVGYGFMDNMIESLM